MHGYHIFAPANESLKPMYSFGTWWKWFFFFPPNGFVYRFLRFLKALWIFLSETINFLRKLHKTKFFGMPPKILPFFQSYVAPYCGHISLNLINMPFKLILRRFEVVFWCLEWECCTLRKIDGNSIHSNPPILYYGFKRYLRTQIWKVTKLQSLNRWIQLKNCEICMLKVCLW